MSSGKYKSTCYSVKYHDADGILLTDFWKGEIPSNIGIKWQEFFDNERSKK